jgi:exodeoxyribonuclease VII small subunit
MAKGEEPISFEQAFEALRRAVEELESGTLPLEAAISRYEAGMKLVKQCNELLDKAELRIQRVGQELSSDALKARGVENPTQPRPE